MIIEEQKANQKETTTIQEKVSWLISDSTITVNFQGKTTMLSRSDAYADKLIKALKKKDFEAIPTLISAAKRIEKFSHGKFQVRDGKIMIDGEEAPEIIGSKIKSFADNGLPYQPLVSFTQKLQQNPSHRAVECLYTFLERHHFTICENGNFLAYKKVRDDFMDIHSGTFDNSPGNTVKMPRNKVDDNPNNTCSRGLHCSNFEYATGFGSGKMLEVEVNPKDVCSVPIDYGFAKMRVCQYKVLRVIKEESHETLRYENDDKDSCINCDDDGCTGNCDYNDEEEIATNELD